MLTRSLSMCRWVVPLLWLPLAAWCAWSAWAAALSRPGGGGSGGGGTLASLAALVVAGVLLWQLIEYSLHRWAFHASPAGPLAITLHFLLHGWVRQRWGVGWVWCGVGVGGG